MADRVAVCITLEIATVILTILSIVLLTRIAYGACTVQPTSITFSSEELVDMIERCGLSTLIQFPPFLAVHLQNARQDPKLLSLLRGLNEISYGGLPLSLEDEDWAEQNGIKLRARSKDLLHRCIA